MARQGEEIAESDDEWLFGKNQTQHVGHFRTAEKVLEPLRGVRGSRKVPLPPPPPPPPRGSPFSRRERGEKLRWHNVEIKHVLPTASDDVPFDLSTVIFKERERMDSVCALPLV